MLAVLAVHETSLTDMDREIVGIDPVYTEEVESQRQVGSELTIFN